MKDARIHGEVLAVAGGREWIVVRDNKDVLFLMMENLETERGGRLKQHPKVGRTVYFHPASIDLAISQREFADIQAQLDK